MDTLPCKYPEKNTRLGMKEKKSGSQSNSWHPSDDPKAKNFETKLYNKIEDNFHLANKKALFFNLKNYYESLD